VTRYLALTGGLIQVAAALGLLFLPVFATCYENEPDCRRESYIQMGGSVLGYILLGGIILLGIAVVITNVEEGESQNLDKRQSYRLLWLAAVWSLVTVVLGAWSIGLAFAPSAALLLLAALDRRKSRFAE
jgi:hypothetical protein